jgi:RNA polymerase sigma-70 factor (ECF subfamily)
VTHTSGEACEGTIDDRILRRWTSIESQAAYWYGKRVNDNPAENPELAGAFVTTHWSLVLRARDKSEAALEVLFSTYREPLLVWLRAEGYALEDAEDLLHGFVEGLLRREAFKGVASEKGKFRTFLLRCLKYHIRDERDRRMAAKRGGGQAIESLDQTDGAGAAINQPSSDRGAPDLEYDRAWAKSVLNNSFRRLEKECARRGQMALYTALEPVIFCDDTASPYREIGLALAMSEPAVKMAASRIRSRLRDVVREEVMQTVSNQQDWQEEVRYLIQLFGREPGIVT